MSNCIALNKWSPVFSNKGWDLHAQTVNTATIQCVLTQVPTKQIALYTYMQTLDILHTFPRGNFSRNSGVAFVCPKVKLGATSTSSPLY